MIFVAYLLFLLLYRSSKNMTLNTETETQLVDRWSIEAIIRQGTTIPHSDEYLLDSADSYENSLI